MTGPARCPDRDDIGMVPTAGILCTFSTPGRRIGWKDGCDGLEPCLTSCPDAGPPSARQVLVIIHSMAPYHNLSQGKQLLWDEVSRYVA